MDTPNPIPADTNTYTFTLQSNLTLTREAENQCAITYEAMFTDRTVGNQTGFDFYDVTPCTGVICYMQFSVGFTCGQDQVGQISSEDITYKGQKVTLSVNEWSWGTRSIDTSFIPVKGDIAYYADRIQFRFTVGNGKSAEAMRQAKSLLSTLIITEN